MNGVMYFAFWSYSSSNNSFELWRSDGTANGTALVTQVPEGPYSNSPYLAVYQGTLYFRGWDQDHGAELWRSDGTAAGTGLFIDLNPNGDGSPRHFFVGGNTLYFLARHESGRWLLWTSDGTPSGTRPILTEGYDPYPGSMAFLNGILYFPAQNASGGQRL